MKKILLASLFLLSVPVFTQDMVKEELSLSVTQAVKSLETTLKAKGLTVFAKIDHMQAAKKVNLEMKPAVVIVFGNPSVGTVLMNANPMWAYELPLRIAIYEDAKGKVWAQTRLLVKDIPSPSEAKRVEAMNGLLKALVKIK